MSVNPYAPPSDDAPPTSDHADGLGSETAVPFGPERFATLAVVGKPEEQPWRIGFHDEGLTLRSPDGDTEIVTLRQLVEQFDVTPLGQLTLLRWEPRKLHLRLDVHGAGLLRTWSAPVAPRWGRALGQRRHKPRLVTGLIFAVGTVLAMGSGALGLLLPLLAVGSLVSGIGARVAPGRWLFAWTGIYVLVLALVLTAEVAWFGRHWGWLALSAIFAWAGTNTLRKFRFLRPAA